MTLSIPMYLISVYAQTINFSGKDVHLKKIFATIKKQTGTVFFYDEALMKEAKPVTVNLRNATLETALNEIFKDQALTWTAEDKTVTITRRPVSITTPAENNRFLIPQQFVQAKGNNDDGNPISDVSVTVKGKQQERSVTTMDDFLSKLIQKISWFFHR